MNGPRIHHQEPLAHQLRLDGYSITLSRDLTLVTGNLRHFARVPGLRVENWLATGR